MGNPKTSELILHPEEYTLSSEERRNTRANNHMNIIRTCDEEMTIHLIRVQALTLLRSGNENVIIENTRKGDVSLDIGEYQRYFLARMNEESTEGKEPKDGLRRLEKEVLDIIYMRLTTKKTLISINNT